MSASAYQAVILAAGRGSRLGARTQDMPKALLPLGPRSRSDATTVTLLQRQVEVLAAAGVHDIVIVVGFQRERIREAARAWPVPVRCVDNLAPDLTTSGSLHSLQWAVRAEPSLLDGTRPMLWMDADIVYPRQALQLLLHAPEQSAILVSALQRRAHPHGANDEAVLVYGRQAAPRFLGKGLTPELVMDAPCLGEAVGIVKLAPSEHALARACLRWMLGDPEAPADSARSRGFSPARAATEHEELSQRFMHCGKLRCVRLDATLPWMECDDEADYQRLCNVLYPQLLDFEQTSADVQVHEVESRPMILLTPGPANTSASVKAAMTKPDVCPREREFGAVLQRVRDALTRVVHAGDEFTSVLLGGSGTAAVEAAIASAVPSDGRVLVIDNGAYGARIAEIAQAYGIAHDRLQLGVGCYPDLRLVARALDAASYTQLAMVHHETSTGMLNPVDEIAKLCRARGVEVLVDAISSYAGIPIEIESLGADLLIGSSGKCVQGMPGLGFVIGRRTRLAQLHHLPGRSYYLDLGRHHHFLQAHGQSVFTPPVPVVHALDQALQELADEGGPTARHRRYVAAFESLDAGMRQLGFRRLLPDASLSRILTAYIEPDHPLYSFDAMHDRLHSSGFTIYPGSPVAPLVHGADARTRTFRLANMGALTQRDITRFVAAISSTLAAMGVRPLYAS